MAYFLGIDLPSNKRVVTALTKIFGIGDSTAKKVLSKLQIDSQFKVQHLPENSFSQIREYLDQSEILIEGDLKRRIYQDIKRLINMKSYRGIRLMKGLPVRGQRTRTNSRTSRKRLKFKLI